ncbi:sphingosine-1-phosphate phosphatase 2-like [Sitophilus oryzae]|uniref:Sphingosine-1-phosphate phosphatase 2-like n=1 Tax=Sitophilus oryzae TaxID=7048 RepID=A0A6J2XQE2_SITOR|nr:sphingosine-1-phosphate phosphatase 2-like [Sitophilus oryzae]
MERLGDPVLVAKIQKFFGVDTNFNKASSQKSDKPSGAKSTEKFVIRNKFWYYLFLFGTALGDEVFYTGFIPFWFWNIDGAVGRRVVLVWTLVMYIGQGIKDLIRWPRPGPPVVQLQSKWALEYGFPSTHAMVGVSIPFSVLLFTINRYQYDVPLGLAAAITWCSIICLSRLYLGMHTVLDILAGLLLAVVLMVPLVPAVDYFDNYILTNPTSPVLLLTLSILMIIYYPNSGKWTPTRGDTTMIISVCVGVLTGAWLNYQSGFMTTSDLPLPRVIMWPSWTMWGCLVLRTLIGFFFVFLTRQITKPLSYSFICTILKKDEQELKQSENTWANKHKTIAELGCKFVTCAMIGFNIMYLLPQLFKFLRIERPTFFTEI